MNLLLVWAVKAVNSHRDKVWWVIISDVSRIDLAERDVETL